MRPAARMALLACLLGAAGLLTSPALASAVWGNAWDEADGALLVSADYARLEQGDDATVFAAVSADGRYVAIQTRARNFFAADDPDPAGRYRAGGVFRFDLQSRELRKVADGDLFEEEGGSFLRRGASNPTISANGRYVAFVTAEPLVAADVNDNVDAYVRDMAVPIGGTGAFDLVSARDGGDGPAKWGAPAFPFPGSEPGADLSRGVALSADGRKVVFRTDAPSDLAASAAVDVPAGQVFVRDRVADTTRLVTARRDAGTGLMTEEPAGGALGLGASISADGTTVAWTGGNAGLQTRFLKGENADPNFLYYLWRRVAVGPLAPTRRITGLADPDDPACPPGVETIFDLESTGPCYGPLTDQESNRAGITSQVPALSGDGYTVAFLTGAGPRPLATTGPGLDLFLTEMRPGSSRKSSTLELTRDTVGGDAATSSALSSIAISSSGRFLAIVTARTRFTLPALRLLGDGRPVPGPRELYVADLAERTVERVTHSFSGGDTDAEVQNGVTLSDDGSRVAFTSFAGNLFYGDANQRVDAFVAAKTADPDGGPPSAGLGAGGASSVEVDRGPPRIGIRARSRRHGVIAVTVSVPAAGGVRAVVKARAGRPRRLRALAIGTGRARGAGRSEVRLRLRPVRRYRAELRRRGRIRGRLIVTYVASRGGRRSRRSRQVVLREEPAAKRRRGGRK